MNESNPIGWLKMSRNYLSLGFSVNLAAYLVMVALWYWLNVDMSNPVGPLQIVSSISGLAIVAGAIILSRYFFSSSRPIYDQRKELVTVGLPWFLVSLGTLIGILLYLGSFEVNDPLQAPWVLLQLIYVILMILGIVRVDYLYQEHAKLVSFKAPDTTNSQHIGAD